MCSRKILRLKPKVNNPFIDIVKYSMKCTSEKQGRKRPLDTPKIMIQRREREGEREREKVRRRDIEREGEIIEREM